MKQKSKAEAAGKQAGQKAGGADSSARSSAKAKAKTKTAIKAKPAKTSASGFDFVGRVESLIVKCGSGAEIFEFELRGRNGERHVLRLRTSDSFSLNIMAPIVTAAHATDAKIGVRTAADASGFHYVTEVESRPKLGKA